MRDLSIDIETYSEIDIKKAGAYRYALDAEVMLFGYSVDFGEPECIDLMCGEEIPEEIVRAIFDPSIKKSAHNAAFERAVLRQYFENLLAMCACRAIPGVEIPGWSVETYELIAETCGYLPPEQWQCTQVMCARAGYPLDLDSASVALGTAAKKDKKGRDLIRLFSVPCKPTKSNGMRTRNLPEHFPDRWQEFIDYCKQDVRTEQAIATKLQWVPVLPEEEMYWHENEKMNERGIRVSKELVEGAVAIDAARKAELMEEAADLTGLDNPNSVKQMLGWLNDEGLDMGKLTKESVKEALELTDDETVTRVLELRQEIARSSIKKYSAIQASLCPDGRVRGMIQFNGAPRTGRDAGRIIQPQNLPRMYLSDTEIDIAREAVSTGDMGLAEMLWPNIPDLLSQLIRTTLVAEEGKRFIVADLSSIESRVLAWLAGEEWKLDVFNSHGKIYEAMASRMFGVPFESITKDSEYRQQGKVAELSLGYQGSVGAINKMDKDNAIPDRLKKGMVDKYRSTNRKTVKFWYDLDGAARKSIKNPGAVFKVGDKGLAFCTKKSVLMMRLPSGRLLHYPRPFIGENRWGGESIGFWGVDQKNNKKWAKLETYGGSLAENATQATARDVLMFGTHRIVEAGYHPFIKVHDETGCEEKYGFGSVEELEQLLCSRADWMGDLPLAAAGFESLYYKK